MNDPRRVLWIEDDHRFARMCGREWKKADLDVEIINSVDDLEAALGKGPYAVVVYDWALDPGNLFADEDTEGGLRTGAFLQPWLHNRLGAAIPQVVYTASPEFCPFGTHVHSKMLTRPSQLGQILLDLITTTAPAT